METEGKKNPLPGEALQEAGRGSGEPGKPSAGARTERAEPHGRRHPGTPARHSRARGKELKAVSRQENKNATALLLLALLI